MSEIEVHDLSDDPTRYWESWVKTASKFSLEIENPPYERCPDKVRNLKEILNFFYISSS